MPRTTTRRKKPSKKKAPKDTSHLKKSKSGDFLERFRRDTAMVDYLTSLRVLNPAAERGKSLNEPRREGGFVRLAHAREEVTAPIITKGKSVARNAKKK